MREIKPSVSKNLAIFDSGIPVAKKRKRVFLRDIERKYQDFCAGRPDIQTGGMPDFRKSLYDARVFDGRNFEIGETV